MTNRDIEVLLRQSMDRFIDELASMSLPDWCDRPAPEAWSASEITEHVAIANRGILARLTKGLESPLAGPRGVTDDEIPYLFYRGDEPPNVATPTGTWTEIAPAITEFTERANALIVWHRTTDLDLRAHGATHPAFGTLDAMQWLLFAGAHTERHRAQLIGLKRARASETRDA